MKSYLILHSLDGEFGETDWTFCSDYQEMCDLIQENRTLYGKRYKVINAVKIGISEQFNDLIG